MIGRVYQDTEAFCHNFSEILQGRTEPRKIWKIENLREKKMGKYGKKKKNFSNKNNLYTFLLCVGRYTALVWVWVWADTAAGV